MIPSVLFVPKLRAVTVRDLCFDYATRHGYKVDGVVSVWDDVYNIIMGGWRGVAIAGDRSHVPADRLPRWAFVSEEQKPGDPPADRRPRLT